MRLFIAINFDEATKQKIIEVQGRLSMFGQGAFSRPENLHLTLAFLGEVAPDQVEAVKLAMEQTSLLPLELDFVSVGSFGRERGDIWWIGLAENQGLRQMQAELSSRLMASGFQLDSRPFSPHITLARKVKLKEQPDREALLGQPWNRQRCHQPDGV